MGHNKFIINQGNLMMGHVNFHKELSSDHTTTKGGGWYHIDHDNKKVYLYDVSMDFGQAKREDVIAAIQTGDFISIHIQDYEFIHSYQHTLATCKMDSDKISIFMPEENKY